MPNLKSLNTIARKDYLKLIQGNGYLYWIGLNDNIHDKLFQLESTSVYVCYFKHLSWEQWLNELELIKQKINLININKTEDYIDNRPKLK